MVARTQNPLALTEKERISIIDWLNTQYGKRDLEYCGRTNNHIFTNKNDLLFKVSKDPYNKLDKESLFYSHYGNQINTSNPLILPYQDVTLYVEGQPVSYSITGFRYYRNMKSAIRWDNVPTLYAWEAYEKLISIPQTLVRREDRNVFGVRTQSSIYAKVAQRVSGLNENQQNMFPRDMRNDILALLQEKLYERSDLFPEHEKKLTHGDCLPQNFLYSEEDKGNLYWIDYESAQLTDPLWDISKFLLSLLYLNPNQAHTELTNYILRSYDTSVLYAYLKIQLVTMTSFALYDSTPERFIKRYTQIATPLRNGELPEKFEF